MVKDHRITYRRRHSYRTATNKIRPIKTPGGRYVGKYIEKRVGVPRCADTGKPLSGLPRIRPYALKRQKKNERTISRAYGGYLCHSALRQRVVRAFLLEEQKIAKKLMSAQKAPKKQTKSDDDKKKSKDKKSSASSKKKST